VAVKAWEWERRRSIEGAFDFLVDEYGCRRRGRFFPSGVEIFYWNAMIGVKASVETREEFTVQLCPPPGGVFPPRVDMHASIEWFDAFDVVLLETGRLPEFPAEQRFNADRLVLDGYAAALRGPCRPLFGGDPDRWARLRRQRQDRIAENLRRYPN
jgi:hypothetical protein